MTKLLNSFLTKGLTEEEIKSLVERKETAKPFLKRLKECLDQEIEEKIKQSENEIKYSDPNWMLYQADNRGYRRALRKIKDLIQ